MKEVMLHKVESGAPSAKHYLAKSLGAPFKVYLTNGVEVVTAPDTGKGITRITDLAGLLTAVVRARVMHARKLSGADLKFIRTALYLKSQEVAAALDLTPEHYSRCETGPKTMSAATEKLYRMYIFLTSFTKDWHVRDAVRESVMSGSRPSKSEQTKAKKTLDAFKTVFIDMKLDPVCNADDEIAFVFSREACGEKSDSPQGGSDDDAEWKDEGRSEAA